MGLEEPWPITSARQLFPSQQIPSGKKRMSCDLLQQLFFTPSPPFMETLVRGLCQPTYKRRGHLPPLHFLALGISLMVGWYIRSTGISVCQWQPLSVLQPCPCTLTAIHVEDLQVNDLSIISATVLLRGLEGGGTLPAPCH